MRLGGWPKCRRALKPVWLKSDRCLTGQGIDERATTCAKLQAAWEIFLDFAVEAGAVDKDDAALTAGFVQNTLIELAEDQKDRQADNDPARQFLDKLRSAINSGGAHLASPENGTPENWKDWGWRWFEFGGQIGGGEPRGQGKRVSWVDGDDVFLDPGAAHDITATGLTEQALWKLLHEKGLLASVEVEGDKVRRTIKKMIGGSRLRVIHLRAASLGMEKGGAGGAGGAQFQNTPAK